MCLCLQVIHISPHVCVLAGYEWVPNFIPSWTSGMYLLQPHHSGATRFVHFLAINIYCLQEFERWAVQGRTVLINMKACFFVSHTKPKLSYSVSRSTSLKPMVIISHFRYRSMYNVHPLGLTWLKKKNWTCSSFFHPIRSFLWKKWHSSYLRKRLLNHLRN